MTIAAAVVVAMDPGIRGCGLAMFEAGRLKHATYVRNPTRKGSDGLAITTMGLAVGSTAKTWLAPRAKDTPLVCCVEMPQVYAHGKGEGDPNDLIPLAAVDGALLTALPWSATVTYRPRVWKGTIDPDILTARLCSTAPGALLYPDEHTHTDKVCTSLAHNMWDAVGIGLYYLGRLHMHGKVYPGASPG
jgi:hypothetical protein